MASFIHKSGRSLAKNPSQFLRANHSAPCQCRAGVGVRRQGLEAWGATHRGVGKGRKKGTPTAGCHRMQGSNFVGKKLFWGGAPPPTHPPLQAPASTGASRWRRPPTGTTSKPQGTACTNSKINSHKSLETPAYRKIIAQAQQRSASSWENG